METHNKSRSVFTEEMFHLGEKIKVGMQFNFTGDTSDATRNGPYIAIGISKTTLGDKVLTYEYGSGSIDSCWLLDGNVKPIDIRTSQQKTIDDIVRVDEESCLSKDFAKSFLNKVKKGKVHNIIFTGDV